MSNSTYVKQRKSEKYKKVQANAVTMFSMADYKQGDEKIRVKTPGKSIKPIWLLAGFLQDRDESKVEKNGGKNPGKR